MLCGRIDSLYANFYEFCWFFTESLCNSSNIYETGGIYLYYHSYYDILVCIQPGSVQVFESEE